jgi:hypothetical protein
MKLKTMLMITVLIVIGFLVVCEKKGAAEKAGKSVDDAVEKVQDKAKEVTE